jgi:hypothetical protein
MAESVFLVLAVSFLLIPASSGPKITIFKVSREPDLKLAPPLEVQPDSHLAVQVANLEGTSLTRLRVFLSVDKNGDGLYEEGEEVLKTDLKETDIHALDLTPKVKNVLIPLWPMDRSEATTMKVELFYRYDGSSEISVSTAHLTLDWEKALRRSPKKLVQSRSRPRLWARFRRIYDRIRDDPAANPRNVFLIAIERGEPKSPPRKLGFPRAIIHGLCLSPKGKRLALVRHTAGMYELLNLELWNGHRPRTLFASPDKISSPHFMDGQSVAFIHRKQLCCVKTADDNRPMVISLPGKRLTDLHLVTALEQRFELIFSARADRAEEDPLPFLARIRSPSDLASVYRLPVHRYYNKYDRFVEGAPLFLERREEENEGIYFFNQTADQAKLLYKCRHPGLIAVAADGSVVAFAAAEEEPTR